MCDCKFSFISIVKIVFGCVFCWWWVDVDVDGGLCIIKGEFVILILLLFEYLVLSCFRMKIIDEVSIVLISFDKIILIL